MVAWFVVLLFVLWTLAVQALVWFARSFEFWGTSLSTWIAGTSVADAPSFIVELGAGVVLAVVAVLLSAAFGSVAHRLSVWGLSRSLCRCCQLTQSHAENHALRREIEVARFSKHLVFQFFNMFCFPLYLIFIEKVRRNCPASGRIGVLSSSS